MHQRPSEPVPICCPHCGFVDRGNFCSSCGQPLRPRVPERDVGAGRHGLGLVAAMLRGAASAALTFALVVGRPLRLFRAYFGHASPELFAPARRRPHLLGPYSLLIAAIAFLAIAETIDPDRWLDEPGWRREAQGMIEAYERVHGKEPGFAAAGPAILPETGLSFLDGLSVELERLAFVIVQAAFLWVLLARRRLSWRDTVQLYAYVFGAILIVDGLAELAGKSLIRVLVPPTADLQEAMAQAGRVAVITYASAALLRLYLIVVLPFLALCRIFGFAPVKAAAAVLAATFAATRSSRSRLT